LTPTVESIILERATQNPYKKKIFYFFFFSQRSAGDRAYFREKRIPGGLTWGNKPESFWIVASAVEWKCIFFTHEH